LRGGHKEYKITGAQAELKNPRLEKNFGF